MKLQYGEESVNRCLFDVIESTIYLYVVFMVICSTANMFTIIIYFN